MIGGRVAPRFFTTTHRTDGHATHAPALIDDATVIPHARFSSQRLVTHAIVGLGLWAGAIGALQLGFGGAHVLTQMAWFFTGAALLTFGGAYAVLPYVVQAAVVDYRWLSTGQMIDGLALGESTPGPLIMIVSFVGFVGGWQGQLFGSEHMLLAGTVAACVTTFFTFLPSFLFILLGGPLVEATRDDLKFTAPLTAITAAVVGVIVNLALFFAVHVFWPAGIAAAFEWPAALIAVAAAVALFRYDAGIIRTIAACAAAGLLYTLAIA